MPFRFKARILLLRSHVPANTITKLRNIGRRRSYAIKPCCFCTVSAVNEGYRRSRLGRSLKLNELATKKGHGPTNFATSFAFSFNFSLSLSLSFFLSFVTSPRILSPRLIYSRHVSAAARTRSQKFGAYFAWRIEDRVEQRRTSYHRWRGKFFGGADGHD